MSNEIERRREARFWREYDDLVERGRRAVEAARTAPRHRCQVCGDYDDDSATPCCCQE